ncbi:MAG TPA: BON domain-containing protein [Gammaproteobacteria bacterium]|nr:BON domain-containing protein [Gammaproteobacteria bacterium]
MNRIIRSGLVAAACAAGAIAVGACSHNSQTPAGQISNGAQEMGQGIAGVASDSTITTKVKAKMAANTGLSSFSIHVSTTNGIVTLTGTVDTDATRDLAEHVAATTGGVKSVNNELKVGG